MESTDGDQYWIRWSEERAYRTGTILAKSGMVLAIVATFVDLFYSTTVVVIGDLILVLGCCMTIAMSRGQPLRRYFVWWPMYFGLWISSFPGLWSTGGIHSPWIGFLVSLFAISGTIVQTKIPSKYILAFSFLNIIGWALLAPWVPHDASILQPTGFISSVSVLCLFGTSFCIEAFLRTEKELSEEFARQYNENQAKSAFLANISHELRTPLGAILGYADLLQSSGISEDEKAQFAKTIQRNGAQLSHLVDDLLDLSKVEAGRIEIEHIDFNLVELLDEILALLDLNAKKKGIELKGSFTTPVPNIIRSDIVRIKQIILNLMGNAIKFTNKGAVELEVRFHGDKTCGDLIVAVKDSGCGISPEEKEKLFKPFSQADASMTRRFGGTGLGLSLSRELTRLMGGELALTHSRTGYGSEFTFYLPVDVPARSQFTKEFKKAEVRPISPPIEIPNFSGVRILVVDDSIDNRDLVRRFLEPTGAIVEEAVDGLDGVKKAEGTNYDMVFMDIQMPIMDGFQATSILRQHLFRKPIVAITAHAMKQDRDKCIEAGCDDHLAKPIQRQALMRMVHQYRVLH